MLSKLLLWVLALVALSQKASTHCPASCICNDMGTVCNSLNFGDFEGFDITNLKIIHPEERLILDATSFNVSALKKVNSIVIENATILSIDSSAFAGLPLLLTLSIINSVLPNIGGHILRSTNIKMLQISNSTLTTLENFDSHSLEELDLSGCSIKTITNTSFVDLPYLTYLNLANNEIEKIESGAFNTLESLQEIYLSHNLITELNSNVFLNNTALTTIDLSFNPLLKLNMTIDAELEKLVFGSLGLKTFDTHLPQLALVSYLDLSNNRLELSKSTFKEMNQLEYIDLSNNGLVNLNPKIFNFNDVLQKIILNNNNFTVLPKFLCEYDLFETHLFSCRNCNLIYLLNDTFQHFGSLVTLDLSHNHLNGINLTVIQDLPNIIKVDLSYNDIGAINPLSFIKSSALTELKLAGNPLLSLDTLLFARNRVLRSLDLSFCNLKHIWEFPIVKRLPSVKVIDISNNFISAIEKDELRATPELEVFDISNNPLNCDNKLRDSITWLIQRDVSSKSSNNWKSIDNIRSVLELDKTSTAPSSWKDFAKTKCPLEYYEKYFSDAKTISTAVPAEPKKIVFIDHENDWQIGIEDEFETEFSDSDQNSDESDADIEENEKVRDAEQILVPQDIKQSFSILWPTLVFIFTAITVLIIAANVLLLVVRSRMNRGNNPSILPHIRIPQWNSQGKIKKHSGSVYRPLSEDRSDLTMPSTVWKEYVPTHIVLKK